MRSIEDIIIAQPDFPVEDLEQHNANELQIELANPELRSRYAKHAISSNSIYEMAALIRRSLEKKDFSPEEKQGFGIGATAMTALMYLVNPSLGYDQYSQPLHELRPLLGQDEIVRARLEEHKNHLEQHNANTLIVLDAVARQEHATAATHSAIRAGAAIVQLVGRHMIIDKSHRHLV